VETQAEWGGGGGDRLEVMTPLSRLCDGLHVMGMPGTPVEPSLLQLECGMRRQLASESSRTASTGRKWQMRRKGGHCTAVSPRSMRDDVRLSGRAVTVETWGNSDCSCLMRLETMKGHS